MSDDRNQLLATALHRYEIISAYIADCPQRGVKLAYLQKLAERPWTRPDGEVVHYSVETLRKWVRRYAENGLDGLLDAPRPRPGGRALSLRVIEEACRLKREVPERSVKRIIKIMEDLELVERGVVRLSTLHRALKARGLSARKLRLPEDGDLDRWQADYACELWQADMLQGPWLPDPERPGKMRRSYLYAFIDDASRLLLHGRFSFKGDLPALELVLRRSIQRWGVPSKVYYDNGMTFRSHHMKAICARLGIHRPIFTKRYRPMGHGKIEAFNRNCKNAFIAEVKATRISTLSELNEAFVAWVEEEYNVGFHSELQMSPLCRFQQDADRRRFADEEDLRQAFLWQDSRKTDKCGVLTLCGIAYQCSARLARRRVEVRYDPEFLDTIEVWHQGRFFERVGPLEVLRHRRGQTLAPNTAVEDGTAGKTDWLSHIVKKRRRRLRTAETNEPDTSARELAAFLSALRDGLHSDVFDKQGARDFFHRYGPFEPDLVVATLESLLQNGPADLHQSYYLDQILGAARKGEHSQ